MRKGPSEVSFVSDEPPEMRSVNRINEFARGVRLL
jgi:hypothetical protein